MKLSLITILTLSTFITGCTSSTKPAEHTIESETIASEDTTSAINEAPISSNLSLALSSNRRGNFSLKATDIDHDPITFEIIRNPLHGKITKFDTKSGTFSYVPNDGFTGKDTFTFKVSDGLSSSANKTVTIDVQPQTLPVPKPPTNLVVSSTNSCALKLTWQDNSDNEDGFEIYKDGELYCVKDADTTSAIIDCLHANTTYTFQVRAKNASGTSTAAQSTIKTVLEETIPNAPSNLSVTKKSDTIVRLAWKDNAENENGYEIYQDGKLIKTISSNCTCTMISGLTPEMVYDFQVRAKNTLGHSAATSLRVKTKPVASTPVIISNKAPTIDTLENHTIMLGDTATLTATASDSDGTIVQYNWSEDASTLGDKNSLVYTPTTEGEHTLTLTVTDDDNETAKTTVNVFVKAKEMSKYPLHKEITTTVFWIGEESSSANGNIPNLASAWDDEWMKHYGGVDDPEQREGSNPAAFTPKENPFYVALPFNDFDENGTKKSDLSYVPWASAHDRNDTSIIKNRWIKIIKGDRVVYAQWEDVGPFGENDVAYVFADAKPHNTTNNQAGLDVSPAVRDYLGLNGMEAVDWQFVDEKDVPDGAWKKSITTSNINWVDVIKPTPDTIKPVITRKADAVITLTVGDNYIDAGATAYDDKDGDISNKIITTGSVNTAVAGTYTIRYNVKDAANNSADEVKRTIIVKEAVKEYGKRGTHAVTSKSLVSKEATAFYPTDYQAMDKMPIIFFTPGYLQDANTYETFIDFLVSHGNIVLVAKDHYGDYKTFIREFDNFLASNKAILSHIDKSKAGFMGHSSGGGNVFKMLEYFAAKGYGSAHHVLVTFDPWLAKGMSEASMKALPSNTNVLFFNFGKDAAESDPRFAVSEYRLLESIDARNKDYIVLTEPNINHYYISDKESYGGAKVKKTIAQMQGVLKPLDALLDYTFHDALSDVTYNIALSSGTDTPIQSANLRPRDINEYLYTCYYAVLEDINYCGNPTIATLNQEVATQYSENLFVDTFVNDAQADLPWSKDATKTISVEDIQILFSKARASDNTVLAVYKTLKMPAQNDWDNYTDSQKALYLINSERAARGLRMFEGIEEKVEGVAKNYAQFLIDNDAFSHTADGKNPKQRLKDEAGIDETSNADFFSYSEDLALFDYGNTQEYPLINASIAMSVYNWIYADKTATNGSYGHRKFLFAKPLNHNYGVYGKEGLIGIGVASKQYKDGDFFHTKKIIVLDGFDPNNKWGLGTRTLKPKIILH